MERSILFKIRSFRERTHNTFQGHPDYTTKDPGSKERTVHKCHVPRMPELVPLNLQRGNEDKTFQFSLDTKYLPLKTA